MHTNETQYYRLPQYVGSDIINPLVDTNGAYEKIDTTMHNIAAEAAQDTADVAALQSKVGSGVFDTTAQNATDAVNELVGELDTADTGIKARLTTAESDIDTLQGQMVTAQGNIVDLQNNKANASDVSAALALKADASTFLDKLIATGLNVEIASVTADGVKTNSQLVGELYSQVTAYQNALADNEYFRYASFKHLNGTVHYHSTNNKMHSKNSGTIFTVFQQIDMNSTTFTARHMNFNNDADFWNEVDIANGNFTDVSLRTDVPANGTTLSIFADTYVKIS